MDTGISQHLSLSKTPLLITGLIAYTQALYAKITIALLLGYGNVEE
jgi:hypothetical protein